jgi:hypothetical protein
MESKRFFMTKAFASMILAAATLAGCASEPTCDYSDEAYMAAQSVASLRAPAGLATPDRSASLTIPATGSAAPAIPTGEGRCLDRPPSYFATGTPGAAPAQPGSAALPPPASATPPPTQRSSAEPQP